MWKNHQALPACKEVWELELYFYPSAGGFWKNEKKKKESIFMSIAVAIIYTSYVPFLLVIVCPPVLSWSLLPKSQKLCECGTRVSGVRSITQIEKYQVLFNGSNAQPKFCWTFLLTSDIGHVPSKRFPFICLDLSTLICAVWPINSSFCRVEMLCRICVVQIQPRKHGLDHADYTVPTRQHELDHTDHTDHTDQEYICPAWQI